MDSLINRSGILQRVSPSLNTGIVSANINTDAIIKSTEKIEFTKEEYETCLKSERSKFVFTHFNKELKKIFKDLRELADNQQDCRYRANFHIIPIHFDIERVRKILALYFIDLGYVVESLPSNSGITLSLS
jgi:hypothetical protein